MLSTKMSPIKIMSVILLLSNMHSTSVTAVVKHTTYNDTCQSQFNNLVKVKENKAIKLHEACESCNVPKANCHCSKQPGICEDVRKYNDLHWTTCQGRIFRAILNFSFGVAGLLGNLLVVIVTIRFRKNLSRCNYLIGGLAASDLLFSISQTTRYVPTFWTCQWEFGHILCSGFPLLKDASSYLSVGFILIIATERYWLIVCPHRKPLSNASIIILCVFNCILGFLVCIPKVIQMKFNPYTGICLDVWKEKAPRLLYNYALFSLFFVFPMVIMSFEHVQIVQRLKIQEATTKKAKIDDKNLRRNKRITRILIAILIAYLLLILPRRLVDILRAHANSSLVSSRNYVNTAVRLGSCVPYGFHVASNPIIYSFFDRRFRKNVKALFSRGGAVKAKYSTTIDSTSCEVMTSK